MIKIQLKRNVLAALAAVVMFSGFAVSSSAALIDSDSTIRIFGGYEADAADLTQATQLSFPGIVQITEGEGDFGSSIGFASFATISFDPVVPGSVLTFANGGEFTSTSVEIGTQAPNFLELIITGVWTLDGFDDTEGQLVLTATTPTNGIFAFEATGSVTQVPVPAAIWLLGSALVSLGVTRRS
ncbi:MAG: VPLPA-CTERM sorting domain-containing protein [Gammaproteobacteria bacterium]